MGCFLLVEPPMGCSLLVEPPIETFFAYRIARLHSFLVLYCLLVELPSVVILVWRIELPSEVFFACGIAGLQSFLVGCFSTCRASFCNREASYCCLLNARLQSSLIGYSSLVQLPSAIILAWRVACL